MAISRRWLRNLILEERVRKKINIKDNTQGLIPGNEFRDVVENEVKDYFTQGKITEQDEIPVFELKARITVRKNFNLEDVYTSVRAIEGVTIVSTEVEKRDVSVSLEKSVIKIKFLKARLSLRHYKVMLYKHIMRVPGVVNIEFIMVKKLLQEPV